MINSHSSGRRVIIVKSSYNKLYQQTCIPLPSAYKTGVKLMRPLAVAASGESNAHLSIHKKSMTKKRSYNSLWLI